MTIPFGCCGENGKGGCGVADVILFYFSVEVGKALEASGAMGRAELVSGSEPPDPGLPPSHRGTARMGQRGAQPVL